VNINIPDGCVLIRLDELKTLQKDLEDYKKFCIGQCKTMQYLRRESSRCTALGTAIKYIKEIINQSECAHWSEYRSWIEKIKDILDRYTRDSEIPIEEFDTTGIKAEDLLKRMKEDDKW